MSHPPAPENSPLVPAILVLLAERFFVRADTWAEQRPGADVRRADGPLSPEAIARHIAGEISLIPYSIAPAGYRPTPPGPTMLWGAFDIDCHEKDADLPSPGAMDQALAAARRLYAALAAIVPASCLLVEPTGGFGIHLWVLMASPTPAGQVQAVMDAALAGVHLPARSKTVFPDLPAVGVERYPKSVEPPPGGYSAALRLPLGVHPRTARRSVFVDLDTLTVLDPVATLWAPASRVLDRARMDDVLDEIATTDALERPRPAPGSGAPAHVPGTTRHRRDDLPTCPDAWRTYQWVVKTRNLTGRTTEAPGSDSARGHSVRCAFPENHAHGDRGRGSAYLIRDGALQHYGCSVCGLGGGSGEAEIDTLDLIRRVLPDYSMVEIFDVAHRIDPERCPDRAARRKAFRAARTRDEASQRPEGDSSPKEAAA